MSTTTKTTPNDNNIKKQLELAQSIIEEVEECKEDGFEVSGIEEEALKLAKLVLKNHKTTGKGGAGTKKAKKKTTKKESK